MPLIPETGAGLANADALVTIAECDAYHLSMGRTTWAGVDALKENAIRRATAVMNSWQWEGLRRKGRAQSLCWPRSGVVDREGYGVPFDQVPAEVKNACAELAVIELVTPNAMTPVVVAGEAVKREKVGELEVEYAAAVTSAGDATPQVSAAMALIADFLARGGGSTSGLFGSSVRA